MAAQRGLNPQAPEYVPSSSCIKLVVPAPPRTEFRALLHPPPLVPAVFPSSPPPPGQAPYNYFAAAPHSPSFFHNTHPFYCTTTSSFPIIQHHHVHNYPSTTPLQPPPPPPPPAAGMATGRQRHQVMRGDISPRSPSNLQGGFAGRGGFCGRRGGSMSHGRRSNSNRVGRISTSASSSSTHQKLGSSIDHNNPVAGRLKFGGQQQQWGVLDHHDHGGNYRWLKKHRVLPLKHSDGKTTVMIKNIPKEFNRQMILKVLDQHCMSQNQNKSDDDRGHDGVLSAYDFLYLPIDFRSGGGCRGYAFVNFTDPRAAWKFYNACNRKTWDFFMTSHSPPRPPKICEIVSAVIQGKAALVKHFEKSVFCCESDDLLPVCFTPARDGSISGSDDELVTERKIGKRIASKNY